MKKRGREINVFSVSALDLFASALGAFILMTLVFIVFFTMTSQESGKSDGALEEALAEARDEAERIRAELEEAGQTAMESAAALARCEEETAELVDGASLAQCRSEVEAAKTESAALAEQLDQVRIPHLDLLICLDITGSMVDQIQGLKQEIVDLARVLDGLAPSAGIGVIAYGDIVYQQVIHRHPIVPTTSMLSLRAFVESLEPEMGNVEGKSHGLPEAVDLALAEAVRANWRPESERRYIVVITDAPAYDNKLDYTFRLAEAFAAAGSQNVSAVMVRNTQAERFLRELARAGNGQFVDQVGGQSMIASVLLAIIDI